MPRYWSVTGGTQPTPDDLPEQPSFVCPRCGARSYHPEDIRWGYCGRCHDYTGDETRPGDWGGRSDRHSGGL